MPCFLITPCFLLAQVSIVIFGGQDKNDVNVPRPGLVASSLTHQMSVDYDGATKKYSFGNGWSTESNGIPRVMGDATLLPNGKIILLNGAQVGHWKSNA